MNCCLLLIILLYCSANKGNHRRGGCLTSSRERNISCDHHEHHHGKECGGKKPEPSCGCNTQGAGNLPPICPTTPPPMPRTQFPFLDSDHGSCGCEGNN